MKIVRTPFAVVAKQRASDTRLPSETVSVCAGVPAVMPRYLGMTTSTSCPSCTSARGRAPTTSANPPVLAKGTASDATIRIFICPTVISQSRLCNDFRVTDQGGRPARPARSESREATALRAIKQDHPELGGAVDMHLELVELYRRVQGRVPLPSLEISADILTRHAAEARPLLRFEDIPLDLTELRLLVRQIADILRRHGALDDADYQRVQTLGRDMKLLAAAGDWYRSTAESHAVASVGAAHVHEAATADDPVVGQVLALAMRPYLSRCAEVLQQRPELAGWTHPHCGLCGGEPEFAVITPAAERHLIC